MANLLPPFARKQLIREYWIRVFAVTLFMLSFLSISIIILSIPIFVHISSELEIMKQDIYGVEAEQIRIEEASKSIQRTNRLISLLHNTTETKDFSYYFDTLEDLAGNRVTIERFSVERLSNGVVENIQIQAVAQTRQILIDFLDTLNTHEEFGRVDVPLANLAQSENINFSVSIPVIGES